MGGHFVLGETIAAALRRAGSAQGRVFRYSFDMLGEGARTAADAARYERSYASAIDAIGRAAGNRPLPDRPGISVKLSALHPRYEATNAAAVMAELVPVVAGLARQARTFDLNFTVDAEEADRLELSLDVVAAVLADPALAGWDGFGLAVQAYQKRAAAVIDWVADLAARLDRRLMVRLVKGAYWDTEIKRAQERGLDDYPVFSRKPMTDLSYLACADRLLAARPLIYPQFATHNALTVATILERAGGTEGYEFQRLHGMGEALYAHLLETRPGLACRTYAPVGGHGDLLAYLVRRLLENGANSSFVALAGDPAVPVATLLQRPAAQLGGPAAARGSAIPRPPDLLAPRRNSRGVELGHRASLDALLASVQAGGATGPFRAAPVVDGRVLDGAARDVRSPIDGAVLGGVVESEAAVDAAMAAAASGFPAWARTPAEARASALERAAELMEAERGRLLFLLQVEAGKTLDDAVAELREAVDFCRYYAAQGRRAFAAGTVLPGPTGERNTLELRGRGPFVAIAPWNFPLAIFVGQVAAALMAGNTVVAKPAEQTPLVAALAVAMLHRAGVPGTVLHFTPGDGAVGARLVAHAAVAGVVFTGSTAVARQINRALAAKDGPIVPLIAETGGINAMIVDATALPEQVADDVLASAFRSAGQRCSALRLLCVQELGGRPGDRERGRGRPHAAGRRPPRDGDRDRPGDRRGRPHGLAGACGRHAGVGDRAPRAAHAARPLCGAARLRAAGAGTSRGRGIRPDPARGALARRRAGSVAGCHCWQRLRTDARRAVAHGGDCGGGARAPAGGQRVCEPQHDRGRGRGTAVRRPWPVWDGTEGGRPQLPAAVRDRADSVGQHGGGRRQCRAASRRRLTENTPPPRHGGGVRHTLV